MRTVIPKNATLIPDHAKKVFTGVIYDVYQWEQEMYDGSMATFEMLRRADSVQVVAIHNDKIVVTNQSQPHFGSFHDVPGGIHDNSQEDELAAAQRELREETGLTCREWRLIHVKQSRGKTEQFLYLFLAYDVEDQVAQNLDAGEKIKIEYYSLEEMKELMTRESFRGPTIDVIVQAESLQDLRDVPQYKGV